MHSLHRCTNIVNDWYLAPRHMPPRRQRLLRKVSNYGFYFVLSQTWVEANGFTFVGFVISKSEASVKDACRWFVDLNMFKLLGFIIP